MLRIRQSKKETHLCAPGSLHSSKLVRRQIINKINKIGGMLDGDKEKTEKIGKKIQCIECMLEARRLTE